MENVNEKILADYRLRVARRDVMKGELTELQRANWKLRKAFTELLDSYLEELDRRGTISGLGDIEYSWCEKAGILD